MNWQFWEWAILALMIWREARNQGEAGMRAVGHVAWNRHTKAGISIAAVIVQDAQFTSINPPRKTYDSQLDVWPTPGDETFKDAMKIANEIIGGISLDPTNGATHYRNPATATSASYQRGVEEGSLIPTAILGDHEFHREVKIARA